MKNDDSLMLPAACYIMTLLGLQFTLLLPVSALVVFLNRKAVNDIARSHYSYLLKTLGVTLVLYVIALVLVIFKMKWFTWTIYAWVIFRFFQGGISLYRRSLAPK